MRSLLRVAGPGTESHSAFHCFFHKKVQHLRWGELNRTEHVVCVRSSEENRTDRAAGLHSGSAGSPEDAIGQDHAPRAA